MATTLDVYRDWLGISETARPLDNYQILKLKRFEDDVPKIRENYRKANAHVRKFAAGDYAKQSQVLLNELAKAMLTLTDASRKAEYDASMGRKDAPSGRRRTMEEILISRGAVDAAKLDKARSFAKAIGVEVRDALLQQKLAPADVVTQAHAEALGYPYLDLDDLIFDDALMAKVPPGLARRHSCVPVLIADGQLMMAAPNLIPPDVEEELRLRVGMPVRTVLCTAAGLNACIAKYYPREAENAALAAKAAQSGAAAAKKDDASSHDPAQRGEVMKQRILFTIVAFNLGFMLYMIIGRSLFHHPNASIALVAAIAAGIGGFLAVATFIVMGKT